MAKIVAEMHDGGQLYATIARTLGITKAKAERLGREGGARTRGDVAAKRAEAGERGEEAAADLDRSQVPQLLRTENRIGGEWDWWRDLEAAEKTRITKNHSSEYGSPPDVIAEMMIANGLVPASSSIDEAMELWLDLTRRADLGGAMERGYMGASPDSYGVTSGDLYEELLGYGLEEQPEPDLWEEPSISVANPEGEDEDRLFDPFAEPETKAASYEPRPMPEGVHYLPIGQMGSCRVCRESTATADERGPICRNCYPDEERRDEDSTYILSA